MIEYESLDEAEKSIKNLNNSSFLGKQIKVGFAFKNPPESKELSSKQ